ncbi:PRC-barrel domain-containing protein [Amorphus orientalis]|uniref:Sporulation protein YlmC with PRC-barrel domain n=1 Tax=Amorphus orientalis TaxID=649198 RepID=A0AAE3VR74_9HYPH|nr:PRC-barrel domain-containing protein [Amorphus orientalis]MDQ0316666.1 sporulation protein YlmC with PRC-barrel domain [Amorphus orientalis]
MRKTLLAAVSAAALMSAGAISPALSQSNSNNETQAQTESQATPTPKADKSDSASTATGQAQSDTMDSGSTDMSSDDASSDTMNQDTAAATDGDGEMSVQQPADTHLSSELTGQPVQNTDGENLADIDDFIIGPDGKISHVIVSFGGFLGLGDKEVMLPWEQLNVTQDEDGDEVVRLAMTQEEIESLPEFVSREDAEARSDAESQPVEGSGSTTTGTTGSGSSMTQ